MKEIKVVKTLLLDILKKNRDAHRKIFEEAQEGYRSQAIKLFEAELVRAKAGKRFQVSFSLVQPSDQTKDYDRVIGMLEMDTEHDVLLSEKDYQSYVLDDWQWKQNFLFSNSSYSDTAAALLATSQQFDSE